MRFVSTFLLLGLTLGLGAYILIYESKTLSTQDINNQEIYLFDTPYEDITYLNVTDLHLGNSIKMEKDADNQWIMSYPERILVDETRIKTALAKLCYVGIFRKLEQNVQYGLDNPSKEIVFGNDIVANKLYVGNLAPLDGNQYVKKAGSDLVYSISANVLKDINTDINLYRNKLLFNFDLKSVRDITISYQDKEIHFLADNDFIWSLSRPIKAKMQQQIMHAVLAEMEKLTIDEFVAEEKSLDSLGLRKPTGKIILKDRNGIVQEVFLGNVEGEFLYLKVKGFDFIGKIKKDNILKYLKANINIYRDRSFINVYPFEVNEVILNNGKNTSRIYKEKIEEKFFWYIEGSSNAISEINILQVRKYFEALRSLVVGKFIVSSLGSSIYGEYGVREDVYLKISTDTGDLLFYPGKIDIEKDQMCVRIASENSLVSLSADAREFFQEFNNDFFIRIMNKKEKVSE